jgi:hypothetical protein
MNINDIIAQDGIIYDRYLGTTLTLPYSSFESIKIQPNDTVTNFNLNSIITKLYDNYLYLYKSAHVASNIIPITAIAAAGNYNGAFNWFRGLSSSQFSAIASLGLNIDKSNVLAVKYNRDLDQYAIATTTGTGVVVLNSNSSFTSLTTAFSSSYVFQGSNVNWQQIQDIIFSDGNDNAMYVLDRAANSITQYDASGFLTNDNVLNNILVYENSIGGFGTYNDSTKFNAPVSIDYLNSEIYVLDAGNSCIKKYDQNLNWKLTYRLFRDFLSAGPIQITHDSYGNNYVLNSNWTVYKYSNNFNAKETIDFTALSAVNDSVCKIVFSQSDSNVFYFITKNNIYKKLVDAPYDTVGDYLLNRFGYSSNEQFTTFATISSVNNGINYDYNFTLSNLSVPAVAYTIKFTGSTTWTAPAGVTSVSALVVAGGGGGGASPAGWNGGGGGGAGGLILSAINVTPGQSYNIFIGAGGSGGTTGALSGAPGQNTIALGLTALGGGGGGGGGATNATNGGNGGSGGGMGNYYRDNTYTAGSGTIGQGNDGGNGFGSFSAGGGGGAGTIATYSDAGSGLYVSIGNISGYYAGGGGGSYWYDGYTYNYGTGVGGIGGGGNGEKVTYSGILTNAINGTANTGGGGGGASSVESASVINGANGGSGIVILAYSTPDSDAGKLSLFQDNLNVASVLTNDVFDVYPLSAITIDKEEYLQNWVINKSISKLLINHMRLRDNITSKFLYDQTTIPGDVLLAGTRYLLPAESESIYFNPDITYYIGLNEIFQNNIINRPFETIFNIQQNMLSTLAADVRDYSAAPQIVYLT